MFTLNPLSGLPDNCVVLDTETTGFDPNENHRILEIGAVRMRDGLPTRETFHAYINPERSVPQGAIDVHGLDEAFLADKPVFAQVVQSFLDFLGPLPYVAHNAPFDDRFINAELTRMGLAPIAPERVFDSLESARKLYPGSPVSLDALCRRHKINLTNRDKHGALIDSELLASVIVEMGGGRQQTLFQSATSTQNAQDTQVSLTPLTGPCPPRLVLDAATQDAHRQFVREKLGEKALWAHIYAQEP